MREFKFRAWDKKQGQMHSVYSINFFTEAVKLESGKEFGFDEVVLVRYTGLEDKNGVEIYEGDIVNVHWFYANHDPETLGVYEDETNLECVEIIGVRGALGFYFEDDFLPLAFVPTHEESFEVIGNIYENPELIQ